MDSFLHVLSFENEAVLVTYHTTHFVPFLLEDVVVVEDFMFSGSVLLPFFWCWFSEYFHSIESFVFCLKCAGPRDSFGSVSRFGHRLWFHINVGLFREKKFIYNFRVVEVFNIEDFA